MQALPDKEKFDVTSAIATKKKPSKFAAMMRLGGCFKATIHEAILHGSVSQLTRALQKMHQDMVRNPGQPSPLNEVDESGRTPLINAVITLQQEMVELLVNAGADVNIPDFETGISPLSYALLNEASLEMIRVLYGAGSDPEAADFRVVTPLMNACKMGNIAAVRLFLQQDLDIDAVDENGWSALHYTAYQGSGAICKMLIAMGAEKQVKDLKGRKPLHMARFKNSGEVVAQLEDLRSKIAFETGDLDYDD